MAYIYKMKRDWPSKLKEILGSDKKLIRLLAFALLFMAAGAGAYAIVENLGLLYIKALPELLTTGYTEVTVDAQVSDGIGVVTLTAGCRQIIAHTESSQAESIAAGLAGYVGMRPNTHDLIKDAFQNLGIEVIMVKITEMRNSTFIGRLILREGNKVVSLDARPSDGTAIAVRVGVPVYINDDLLKDQGKDIC